jgi:hypothetical protein
MNTSFIRFVRGVGGGETNIAVDACLMGCGLGGCVHQRSFRMGGVGAGWADAFGSP